MKRTYFKLTVRGVKKTATRFLSILAIVTVGVGFLSGLLATTPDMQLTADSYYDANSMFDLDIQDYVFGFGDGDVGKIAALDCVDKVMPAYVKDVVMQTESGTVTARVYGVPMGRDDERINDFVLTEGEFPGEGECLALCVNGYSSKYGVGQTVTVSPDTSGYDDIGDTLALTKLRISGLVKAPYYMSIESEPSLEGTGTLGLVLYVPYSAFTAENYNHIFVTLRDAVGLDSFSRQYQLLTDEGADRLKALGSGITAQKRSDKLEELGQKYDGAAAELQSQREQADKEFAEAERLIEEKEGELAQARAALEEKREQLENMKPLLSQEQYAAMLAQLAGAEDKIAAGCESVARARTELSDKQRQAEEGFARAEEELDGLKTAIEDFPVVQWSITDRSDTVSYSSYKSNSEKVAAIAKVFPVFFFMVAALVALTTMTRMVEEERIQIGTLKALGYSKGAILCYYVGYSVAAGLLGGITGVLVGFYTLPRVIAGAYGMMYTLPQTQCAFYWNYALLIIPLAVCITAGATLCASLAQLAERPSTLMLPRAPKPGKRILLERTPLWKHLKFSLKVTARNIFRYKKRLFMTVFGIAGCCALLLTGFGLRDSIHEIVDKQFGEIYRYNLTLALSREEAADDDSVIKGVLSDREYISDYACVYSGSGKAGANGRQESINVMVPRNTDELKRMINLRNRISGDDIAFNADSVVLTEKLCETLGVREGDTVTLTDADGKEADFVVTGVCENYISGFAFVSTEKYESSFGRPEYRVVLAATEEHTQQVRDELSRKLLESDSVLRLSFSDTVRESFSNTVKSLDSIVIVLIVSAGLLAVIVLYNLTNINICERKKELATLKVLGFTDRETGAYIFRETVILCVLGILLGLVLGIGLHAFVVRTAEVDSVMFGRSISWLSYLLSAVITVLFTAAVDLFMRKKVNSVDMVAAMKANE